MADQIGNERVCRIGVMSRIDYGSGNFRAALLEQAKVVFRQDDVHYIVLAAGLIAGKEFQDQHRRRKRELSDEKRELWRDLRAERDRINQRKAAKKSVTEASAARIEELLARIDEIDEELEDMRKGPKPEEIAEELKEIIPRFTDKRGKTVKIHIVPSSAYDGTLGELVSQHLARLRKDIYSYRSDVDVLKIEQAGKRLEVLTPVKRPWLRGDYASTPHERLIKDREKSRTGMPADILLVAGFGASILKPQGESPLPYLTAPVLSKIGEAKVAENQVGVLVMEVHRDLKDPIVRNYSFKGMVNDERTYIRTPPSVTETQRQIIELVRAEKVSTGDIADKLGIPRAQVEQEAGALIRGSGPPRKTWSGLIYYEDSHRWDFDREWMMHELRYPATAPGANVVRMLSFGCPHIGCNDTDLVWFMNEMVDLIVRYNVMVVVDSGDNIEGHKHNLLLKGAIYRGINDTTQELLAGKVFGSVIAGVFRIRFDAFMKEAEKAGRKLTPEAVLKAVLDALITFYLIAGNHDLWSLEYGQTPLVVMKTMMVKCVTREVETTLKRYGLTLPFVYDLVSQRIIEPPQQRTVLSSGLRMSILHPHMSRSKTQSIRPQEMLAKELGTPENPGSQVVVGANFHVGMVICEYSGLLGQRVCIQCGTLKHRSEFEDNKLKIVDQGVILSEIRSDGDQITSVEAAFYGNKIQNFDRTENEKLYDKLLAEPGLP